MVTNTNRFAASVIAHEQIALFVLFKIIHYYNSSQYSVHVVLFLTTLALSMYHDHGGGVRVFIILLVGGMLVYLIFSSSLDWIEFISFHCIQLNFFSPLSSSIPLLRVSLLFVLRFNNLLMVFFFYFRCSWFMFKTRIHSCMWIFSRFKALLCNMCAFFALLYC